MRPHAPIRYSRRCVSVLSTLVPLVATVLLTPASSVLAGFAGFEPVRRADGSLHGDASIGAKVGEAPRLAAARNEGPPIRVDGRLDDPGWRRAETAHGFRTWHPDRGKDPSEETTFKVVYDDRAVYFGVACLETDAANISSCLSRRDRIQDTDVISIYIDPYHDRTTGYNFRVNPAGVQEDAYLVNDLMNDQDPISSTTS
jgi:hypothetical protein